MLSLLDTLQLANRPQAKWALTSKHAVSTTVLPFADPHIGKFALAPIPLRRKPGGTVRVDRDEDPG